MSTWEILLSILGIIGIVVIGAFIIVFLADLLLSIIDGKNGIFFKRKSNTQETIIKEEKVVKVEHTEDRPVVLENNALDKDYKSKDYSYANQTIVNVNTHGYDEELARKEQEELMSRGTVLADDNFFDRRNDVAEKRRREFEELDSLFDDDEEEDLETECETDSAENDKFIEEINKKSLAEYKMSRPAVSEVKEKVEESEKEVEAIVSEIKETEEDVKAAADAIKSVSKEELDEFEAAKAALDAEKVKLEELRKQLREEQEMLEAERERLRKLSEEETDDDAGMRFSSSLTLEEINNQLEKLRMRLKVNERELKANKKEYLPLSRVKRTLENDKKKLRRREAIVAKQKVVLYGVNNYVDINEEKAKKLSEELDLLDGLRLSVQHCEDVINANKERYPILENTFNILTEQNRQLKGDIAELEVKLALLIAGE